MTDDLALRRVREAKSCLGVRPVDLLRTMADDIERGDLKVDGLLLLYIKRPEFEDWDTGAYRCGLTRDAELVLLDLAHERTIRTWLRK